MKINIGKVVRVAIKLAPIVLPLIPAVKEAVREATKPKAGQ